MARESLDWQRRVTAIAPWNRLNLSAAKMSFSDSLSFFGDFVPFRVVVSSLETSKCTLSLSEIVTFLSFLGLIMLFKLDFDHRHSNP